MISPGMNGRFFPANHRPALQEIAFAAGAGFRALQFQGWEAGLSEADLGASFEEVARALRLNTLDPVMEMVVRVGSQGRTASGRTPLDVLDSNLPAIAGLGCRRVHWHLVPLVPSAVPECRVLEEGFYPQFVQAAALGRDQGFLFGFEHNEPELELFGRPEDCAAALGAVPGLSFVFDFNHTVPAHLDAFLQLSPRMSLLHVSDSPLPEVNHHLPLGRGTIDYARYLRAVREGGFSGPAILEIGGLPKSGGYGRDTDEALRDSLNRLRSSLRILQE